MLDSINWSVNKQMENKLEKALKDVFSWCEQRPHYGVRSSDPSGRTAIKRLKKLANELHSSLPDEYKEHYVPYFSKGKSSLPVITWAAICPKRRAIHNSMSIGFCFARNGTGAVFGIMDSLTLPQRWLPTVERSSEQVKVIDINASNYKYNNAFYNPLEINAKKIDIMLIQKILNESSPILHNIIKEIFPIISIR